MDTEEGELADYNNDEVMDVINQMVSIVALINSFIKNGFAARQLLFSESTNIRYSSPMVIE
jgi:hypothetical protein